MTTPLTVYIRQVMNENERDIAQLELILARKKAWQKRLQDELARREQRLLRRKILLASRRKQPTMSA